MKIRVKYTGVWDIEPVHRVDMCPHIPGIYVNADPGDWIVAKCSYMLPGYPLSATVVTSEREATRLLKSIGKGYLACASRVE